MKSSHVGNQLKSIKSQNFEIQNNHTKKIHSLFTHCITYITFFTTHKNNLLRRVSKIATTITTTSTTTGDKNV